MSSESSASEERFGIMLTGLFSTLMGCLVRS